MDFPFKESQIEGNLYLREFEESVDIDDLEWHRDREDRIIEPLEKTDWKFQLENQLPTSIDGKIFIPKGEWHRVIKGSGDLKIKLIKL